MKTHENHKQEPDPLRDPDYQETKALLERDSTGLAIFSIVCHAVAIIVTIVIAVWAVKNHLKITGVIVTVMIFLYAWIWHSWPVKPGKS